MENFTSFVQFESFQKINKINLLFPPEIYEQIKKKELNGWECVGDKEHWGGAACWTSLDFHNPKMESEA